MKSNFLFASLTCLVLSISLTSFTPAPDTSLSGDVLNYTNQFRRSKGLPSLVVNEDMNAIARRHSEDMAKGRVRFGHGGFAQREKQARKKIKSLRAFGENVAFGARSGKDAVSMWKNSRTHRLNMLGRFKYIGIGTAKDRHGRIYYTQIFAD
jgi:uncharacterized protein YkwD